MADPAALPAAPPAAPPAPRPAGAPVHWGESLWIARNPPPPSRRLGRALETDVAVVGAGIAGVSTAFHLGTMGIRTVVLEAARQPIAATAASAGVIAPQLTRHTPGDVLKRLGAEAGGRFLRLLAESGRYLFDLARDLEIDCAAQPTGFLNPIPGEEGAARLRRVLEEWAPFRDDLRLAGGAETRALTGADGYAACLVDPGGGAIDPVAFVQGLAGALPPLIVQLFRESPVTSIARRNRRWVLTTPQGTLTARRVVLCANGANRTLHPALARTVLPLAVYQVATAPPPASMRAAILPGGQALTDSSANVFSIRFDGEGRLITAWPAMGELGAGALTRAINDRLAASLPAWRETPLDFGWKGVAWMNANLLPRITVVDEDLFAVQACNGRGLALNTVIGREIARLFQAPGAYRPAIPLGRPARIPGYALARHMPGLIIAGAGLGRAAARGAARLAGRWKGGA